MTRQVQGGLSDDTLVLIVCGIVAWPVLAGVLIVFWRDIVGWAVHAGILVGRKADPLVVLPNARGAGLDLPRLVIVAAIVVALLVGSWWVGRQVWLLRQVIR